MFVASTFHNIDGGLLFASDSHGGLNYFDLNHLNDKNSYTLPVFTLSINKKPIQHIALPEIYTQHNLFSLSMGLGGTCLFDVRDA